MRKNERWAQSTLSHLVLNQLCRISRLLYDQLAHSPPGSSFSGGAPVWQEAWSKRNNKEIIALLLAGGGEMLVHSREKAESLKAYFVVSSLKDNKCKLTKGESKWTAAKISKEVIWEYLPNLNEVKSAAPGELYSKDFKEPLVPWPVLFSVFINVSYKCMGKMFIRSPGDSKWDFNSSGDILKIQN